MQDGTSYAGREGGTVTVSDAHAPFIRRQVGGDAGLTGHGSFRAFGGTREGRWCPQCRFLANAWSLLCPRCERRGVRSETVPESQMPPVPAAPFPSGCAYVPAAGLNGARSAPSMFAII